MGSAGVATASPERLEYPPPMITLEKNAQLSSANIGLGSTNLFLGT